MSEFYEEKCVINALLGIYATRPKDSSNNQGHVKDTPIYHLSDGPIIGHLTMCFLAYFCEAQMTKLLRRKKLGLESKTIKEQLIDERPLTVVEVMEELALARAMPVRLKDNLFGSEMILREILQSFSKPSELQFRRSY